MGKINKMYGIIGIVALLMLAVTAVSVTAKVTDAGGSNQQATQDTVVQCSDPNGADDEANEPEDAADTDNIEEQCGPQDEADDANEADESGGVADTVVPCSDPNGADDDANEAEDAADTDNIEGQCGPQDENGEEDEADESGGVADTVVPCSDPNGADDDANEAEDAADTDNIEEQCGPQDENGEEDEAGEVDDANEQKVAPGTIDDGADLLPQAAITLEQAITAAQGAAQGALGEVDLEDYKGKLTFNVEVGDNDVKVDAQSGSVLAVEKD